MEKLGIYIHIPFCVQKCNYCDFLSFPADEAAMERYVKCLCAEIKGSAYGKGQSGQDFSVDSIFLGGGTPSILTGNQIFRILDQVRDAFSLTENCEITMEANPKTLTERKLCGYREAGVNRLSIGVQSMEDAILARLGRIHRKEDFLQNYEMARRLGFENINTDLMFSLPGLEEEVWRKTLSQILSLEPEHISFYGLILEEGTPFYEAWRRGELQEVEDEMDRRMYWNTVDTLTARGYRQYEISNAAKPGFYSRHNLKYWSMEPYLGFGLNAHSYIGKKRSENISEFETYLREMEAGPLDGSEKPLISHIIAENGEKEEMEEFMFLGLRKTDGVRKADFFQRFAKSVSSVYGAVLAKNKREGLLKETDERIVLTRKGVDISNYVMMQFLLDDPQ